MKGQLLAAFGFIIASGSLISAPAHAGTSIACSIIQHDIANTLRVTNNTNTTFAKGKAVSWATTDGVAKTPLTGSFLLQSDLAPNQSAFVSISKNSSFSCTASVNTASR